MYYYEVIIGNEFVNICTTANMGRWQTKHSIILGCNEDVAEFAMLDDSYYHAGWMCKVNDAFPHETIDADVIPIEKDVYDTLVAAIENDEEITIENDAEVKEDTYSADVVYEEGEEETLEYLIATKISEMSSTCNKVIYAGFDIALSDGESHHFSLTTQDQLNLITLSTLVASGETVIPYHADGEQCKYYSVEDITAITTMATFYKTYQVSYFNALKLYIQSLTDMSDVTAVYYGMEIPDDFVTDVLRNLIASAASASE